MTDLSTFAQRTFAAFGAVALTVSLLVASFATPGTVGISGLLV